MQMLKATCFYVVRSFVTMTNSQLPAAGDDRKEDKQSPLQSPLWPRQLKKSVSGKHSVFT